MMLLRGSRIRDMNHSLRLRDGDTDRPLPPEQWLRATRGVVVFR